METLSKLFGSPAKVKILKLFIFNPDRAYDTRQVAERTKESIPKSHAEISCLEKTEIIRPKTFFKSVEKRKSGRKVSTKMKTHGWTLNKEFAFIEPLRTFLVNMNHVSHKDLITRLGRGGTLRLIIVSGVFIQNTESRVDLLVVGDHLKRGLIENIIRTIEAEIGKEIRYAIF